MQLATQTTRFASLLTAWQARLADKATVAQTQAAQLAALTPLMARKQEVIAQQHADFVAMVESVGKVAVSKNGHLLSNKVGP